MRRLACYSLKGGVGKTTTAVNLAYVAAREGWRTLLWDLDPQGAASYCFRIRSKVKGGARGMLSSGSKLSGLIRGTDYENLDLLPADFSLRRLDRLLDRGPHPKRWLRALTGELADEYDLLIMDSAPSISLASENVFRASDALLVPLVPSPLSMRTLHQLRRHLRSKGPTRLSVLAFFSMADSRKALHKQTVTAHLGHTSGVLRSVIPYAAPVELMSLKRAPLEEFASNHRACQAYHRLWREVSERLSDD